jgi:hypothetical protein
MFENALHLVLWIIAAIVLAGILGVAGVLLAIEVIARRLGEPGKRPVVALLLLCVGFVAVVFAVLHLSAPSAN